MIEVVDIWKVMKLKTEIETLTARVAQIEQLLKETQADRDALRKEVERLNHAVCPRCTCAFVQEVKP
jgi:outer membrane murein-binding lipoprotein Lpp